MVSKGEKDGDNGNDSTYDLVTNLFDNYAPDLIPQCPEKITVNIDMSLRGILDIDEPRQIVKVNVWFRLNWNDCRLRWNASDYRDKDSIVVASKRIWIPDITLYDRADGQTTDYSKTHSVVNASGHVKLLRPAIFSFTCKIDMKYFPFDRQICPMKFASWSYHGKDLDVSNSSAGDVTVFSDNGEWKLLGLPVKRNVTKYPCCDEPYPDITFYMRIQREHLYYIFNLVMPCCIITMVALLVFYLPPESGEKISLGITVLLSLCVFLLMVSESMPATSDTVPLIAQYFASTISLVSLSCMLTVFVIHVHHKVSGGKEVPRWARVLVIKWLARILCMGKQMESDYSQEDDETGQMNGLLKFDKRQRPTSLSGYGDFSDVSATGNYVGQSPIETTLADQLTVLREIRKHMESEKHVLRVASDWRKLAMVLDRLFFIIVSIVTLVVTLSVLFQREDDDDITSSEP